MIYLLIIISAILSCLLFEKVNVYSTVLKLKESYVVQFTVLSDKKINDEIKQKKLLSLIKHQIRGLIILTFKLVFFFSPFLLMFAVDYFFYDLAIRKLYSVQGILVSVLVLSIYILSRKYYVKLHKN